MIVTEKEVREMYQRMTVRRGGTDCPGEDALVRVACGETDDRERDVVARHLARCSDCARDYQVARGLRPLRGGQEPAMRSILPLAAIVALAAIGLVWMVFRQQRDARTITQLQQQLAARPRIVQATTPTRVSDRKTEIGTPIVDLDADVVRGTTAPAMAIDLPDTSSLYTLILHLPSDMNGRMDVVIDDGKPLPATSSGGSLTITLDRGVVGAGRHVIRVRSGSRAADFRFDVRT